MLNPCPKLPVATLIHGSLELGIGCPSKTEFNFLSSFKSKLAGLFKHPALFKHEYRAGAACPLLKINSSLFLLNAFPTSYFISLKNKTDIISALLKHVDKCPLPTFVVETAQSRRMTFAISFRDLESPKFFLPTIFIL